MKIHQDIYERHITIRINIPRISVMLPCEECTYQAESSVAPARCHLQGKFHLQETGHPYALLQLKVHQPIQIILRAPHSASKPNYSQYIVIFTVEQMLTQFHSSHKIPTCKIFLCLGKKWQLQIFVTLLTNKNVCMEKLTGHYIQERPAIIQI
jgi:hypothetical protein